MAAITTASAVSRVDTRPGGAYWVAWPALGQRLRAARLRTYLNQREVGQVIGATQAQYSFYERGHRRPGRDRLPALAAVLQIDLADLLVLAGYERPPEP